MAREDALLMRLETGSGSGRGRQEATTVENLDALMASVRMNLTNILNSRHGMSEAINVDVVVAGPLHLGEAHRSPPARCSWASLC